MEIFSGFLFHDVKVHKIEYLVHIYIDKVTIILDCLHILTYSLFVCLLMFISVCKLRVKGNIIILIQHICTRKFRKICHLRCVHTTLLQSNIQFFEEEDWLADNSYLYTLVHWILDLRKILTCKFNYIKTFISLDRFLDSMHKYFFTALDLKEKKR